MKKITFGLIGLLIGIGAFAQTYSTGIVPFFSDYSGKIDVTSTTVTLTLIGPSTSWLGLGFDASSMDDVGKDVVIFDSTDLMTDRTFVGVTILPPADAVQNWTVVSNVVNTGVRTVVATRARNTGDSNDYVFPFSAQPLNLVFARRPGSRLLGWHGSGNCSATTVTLGMDSFNIERFKMYPNPTRNFVNIELPPMVFEADIVIYDVLGKKIKETKVTNNNNNVDLSGFKSGFYMMNIKTIDGQGTKTLVIN